MRADGEGLVKCERRLEAARRESRVSTNPTGSSLV